MSQLNASTRSAVAPSQSIEPTAVGVPLDGAAGLVDPVAPTDGLDALVDRAWHLRSIDAGEALAIGGEALAIANRTGDARAAARALRAMAIAHVARADYAEGSATAERALAAFVALDDPAGEAVALATMATASRRTGENTAAQELLARALERAQRSGDPEALTICLNGFGHLHRSTGQYELSLRLHREARDLARAGGSLEEECSATLGIGGSLERLGSFAEALEVYRDALAIAERTGHTRMEAYAAGNIGTTLERLGRVGEALEYELRSLAMKQRAGDRWGLGISYNNLGIIYRYLGEYASALEALLMALDVTREIGDREGESVALNCIGQVYEELGDRTKVFGCYTSSLEIAKEIGFRQGEAYSLSHLGRYHEHHGDLPRALACHMRSLRIAEDTGERYLERSALENIGRAHGVLDDLPRAEQYLRRAIDLSRETGDRLGEAGSLRSLGETLLRSAPTAAASADDAGLACLDQALAIAEEIGNREVLRGLYLALAAVHARRGDETAAATFRARYRSCAEAIFNEEATRRVSELLVGFEGEAARRHARMLGLDEADQLEIDAAVEREVASRMSTMGAPAAPAQEVEPVIVRDSLVDADPTGIVVRTFGEFRVSVGGRELGTAQWKRRRARDLFKLLLINHRRSMTIDEIIETLWEGRADRKSEMLVMNAISHIRSALEPERRRGAGSTYLVGNDKSYALHLTETGWIDFLHFKELIVSARRSSSAGERRQLYEQAVDLYRGDFLKEDYYEPWTATERELLKDAFLEAVEFLAVEYARAGEHDAAIEASRKILSHDSTSERAYEVLVAALVARGRHAEARRMIEECREAFRRELDEDPPEKIMALLNTR